RRAARRRPRRPAGHPRHLEPRHPDRRRLPELLPPRGVLMGFEQDTAVAPAGAAPGRWSGTVHDGWDIGGNANGGYLLGIAARAMAAEAGRPDPVTVTAHYLAPGRPGPVTVDAEVVKQGKRFTTVR